MTQELTPAQQDLRSAAADEFIKSMMLRSARSAPPGGTIRFRVIDHGNVTKTVTISTEDALDILDPTRPGHPGRPA